MRKILELALELNRPVIIMYMSKDKISRRKIKIIRIDESKVYAYCFLREANRYFIIDQMLSAQMCE